MISIVIVGILILILVAFGLITRKDKNRQWLPIAISFLALLVSLFSAFKAELLPSNIIVVGGDVVFVAPRPADPQSDISIGLAPVKLD